MTIKEAIERLKNTDIYNLGHNDRFEELRLYEIAIDTVLEELENRIPKEEVEKYFKNTREKRRKEYLHKYYLENLKPKRINKE